MLPGVTDPPEVGYMKEFVSLDGAEGMGLGPSAEPCPSLSLRPFPCGVTATCPIKQAHVSAFLDLATRLGGRRVRFIL